MRRLYVSLIMIAICVLTSGCGLTDRLGRILSFGSEESDTQSRTGRSLELQEKLAEEVQVEDITESEDAYGNPVLTATVTMPDYSRIFALYRETAEAEAESIEEYEELLLELAGNYLEENGKNATSVNNENADDPGEPVYEITMISRKITVDAEDTGMETEDMKGEEFGSADLSREKERLQKFFADAALEEELNEFAMEMMMEYTIQQGVFTFLESGE